MYEVIYKYSSDLGKHWFLLLMFPVTGGLSYSFLTLFKFEGLIWDVFQFLILTACAWSLTTYFFVFSVLFAGKYTILNVLFSDESDEVSRAVNRLRVYLRQKLINIGAVFYLIFIAIIPFAVYDYVWIISA